MIVELTIAMVVGLAVLAIAQFTSRRPVIKLALMLNRSYASVIVLVTAVGAAFYAVLYVLPQFLSVIAGYNPEQSGQVLFISGIPAFIILPFLPFLLGRVPIKLMVMCGILCFTASCFLDVHLNAQASADQFLISQLLRGFGQILSFMPLNQASVGAVSREDTGDASGLYNMARNIGGSVGLALIGVFVDRRAEHHADAIGQTLNANSQALQERLAGQAAALAARGGDLAHGQMQAIGRLAALVRQQALVMTYSDCFWILGVGLACMAPLVLILREPPPGASLMESH
jgi:DHA2 family multidrug resistance protein